MITNGYLLMPDRIERLNKAGLDHMQISIDNVMPDEVSKKVLKVLDAKLQMLAEHADFHVNINSVVGGGIAQSGGRADHLEAGARTGLQLDHRHHPRRHRPTEAARRRASARSGTKVRRLTRRSYSRFNHFQEAIANGQPNDWRCRAGSRYLYICEDGLVHYCSQQRGYPGIPLADYTTERCEARVPHRKELRTQLHHQLRAPGQLHRPLARPADRQQHPGQRRHL